MQTQVHIAFNNIRALGDWRSYSELTKIGKLQVNKMLEECQKEDDAVVIDHLINGGRWAVLVIDATQYQDRFKRLKIKNRGNFFMIRSKEEMKNIDRSDLRLLVIPPARQMRGDIILWAEFRHVPITYEKYT